MTDDTLLPGAIGEVINTGREKISETILHIIPGTEITTNITTIANTIIGIISGRTTSGM
jgi:hypothetical protein